MPRKFGKTTFGERLREIREAKGLSQKGLGELTDVHPNTIAKLERGEQEPAWPLVLSFAKALGVDCAELGELVDEVEKPAPGRPKKGEK